MGLRAKAVTHNHISPKSLPHQSVVSFKRNPENTKQNHHQLDIKIKNSVDQKALLLE